MLPDFTPSAASRSLPREALWKRSTLTLPPVFAATSSPKRMAVREAEWAGGYRLAKRRVISGACAGADRGATSPVAPAAPTAPTVLRNERRSIDAREVRSGVMVSLPWPSWTRCGRGSWDDAPQDLSKADPRQGVLDRVSLRPRPDGAPGASSRPDCALEADRLD